MIYFKNKEMLKYTCNSALRYLAYFHALNISLFLFPLIAGSFFKTSEEWKGEVIHLEKVLSHLKLTHDKFL